jgi:hypothetical protein
MENGRYSEGSKGKRNVRVREMHVSRRKWARQGARRQGSCRTSSEELAMNHRLCGAESKPMTGHIASAETPHDACSARRLIRRQVSEMQPMAWTFCTIVWEVVRRSLPTHFIKATKLRTLGTLLRHERFQVSIPTTALRANFRN